MCRRQADEENDEATTKTSRNKSAENHIYMLSERRPRIGKGEVHLDLAFHLDGFALEKVRLEFPLLDGLNGSRRERRVPRDQFNVRNIPGLIDQDAQQNRFPESGRASSREDILGELS